MGISDKKPLNILVLQDPAFPCLHEALGNFNAMVGKNEARIFLITSKKFASAACRKTATLRKQSPCERGCFKRVEITNIHLNGTMELIAFSWHEKFGIDSIYCNDEDLVLRAAYLRRSFGIQTGILPEAAFLFRDKLGMKKLALEAGVAVPQHSPLHTPSCLIDFAKKNGFPVVVKPTRGSSSEDINLLRSWTELNYYLSTVFYAHRDKSISGGLSPCLIDAMYDHIVEKYVQGTMYHTNGLAEGGKIVAIWCFKYIGTNFDFTTGMPYGNILLTKEDKEYSGLVETTRKLILAIDKSTDGSSNGSTRFAFHAEFFSGRNQNEFALCEIAARTPGGSIMDLISRSAALSVASISCNQASLGGRHHSDEATACDPTGSSAVLTSGEVKRTGRKIAQQIFRYLTGLTGRAQVLATFAPPGSPATCSSPGAQSDAACKKGDFGSGKSPSNTTQPQVLRPRRVGDLLIPRTVGTRVCSAPPRESLLNMHGVSGLHMEFKILAGEGKEFYSGYNVGRVNTEARFIATVEKPAPRNGNTCVSAADMEDALSSGLAWYRRSVQYDQISPRQMQKQQASQDGNLASGDESQVLLSQKSVPATRDPGSWLRAKKLAEHRRRQRQRAAAARMQLAPYAGVYGSINTCGESMSRIPAPLRLVWRVLHRSKLAREEERKKALQLVAYASYGGKSPSDTSLARNAYHGKRVYGRALENTRHSTRSQPPSPPSPSSWRPPALVLAKRIQERSAAAGAPGGKNAPPEATVILAPAPDAVSSKASVSRSAMR